MPGVRKAVNAAAVNCSIAAMPISCRQKQKIVADAMQRLGRITTPVEPVIGMQTPWRYRNKGIFHADYSDGAVRLGFYEQGSHTFVPAAIVSCLVRR